MVDKSRGLGLGKRLAAARDVGQWLARSQAKDGAARSHGLKYASHGELSQGRRAMRLTLRTNRWTQVAVLAAWVFSSGCQRLPYIDQSKTVPHDPMGATALEDKEVKQADFLGLSNSLTNQMPKVHKPRTTNDPEAEE